MNVLRKIIAHKQQEVQQRKAAVPVGNLVSSPLFSRETFSLAEALLATENGGIIAEFKRKSPSKGWINARASLEKITTGYVRAGAAALSVLTDETFFGGSDEDLRLARQLNACPILRKDFIVDDYQILEARSLGADVILIIAACLTSWEVKKLASFARSLGLEVLLEIHEASELDRLCEEISVIGVNNRNLGDFSVDIQRSLDLLPLLPPTIPKVAESGLSNPAEAVKLRRAGFDGFLIGESFMRQEEPGEACQEFIEGMARQLNAKPHP